jgi:hypothetical protein
MQSADHQQAHEPLGVAPIGLDTIPGWTLDLSRSPRRAHPDQSRCEPWSWSAPPTRLWALREDKSRRNNFPDRVGGPTMPTSSGGYHPSIGSNQVTLENYDKLTATSVPLEYPRCRKCAPGARRPTTS